MNLNDPITTGSRALKMQAGKLSKLGIFTYYDFLFHLPTRYEDYSIISKIALLQPGETATIVGTVLEIKNQYLRGRRVKTIQKASVTDGSGSIELLWFNQPFLTRSIKEGDKISASGKVEMSKKGLSLNSPDFEIIYNEQTEQLHTGRLVPVYPETRGLTSKWLRRQIRNILLEAENALSEYLPTEVIERNNLVDFKNALKNIHFPESFQSADEARRRLSFDELFLFQLAAKKRREEWRSQKKTSPIQVESIQNQLDTFIKKLPFDLTPSQLKALGEILSDISNEKPMNRLLQGDVGSGKTIVSAAAMYAAFLNGFQSVLLSPTEILANQHFQTLDKFLGPLGVKTQVLTRSRKPAGEFDILVGTHAVLNENVKFKKLAFAVIDEQQRFGVTQRTVIREKGDNPHLLTMTATPIPRTVALTLYGDLDLSYLSEIPSNRKRIKTWLVPPEKRTAAYDWIRKQIKDTSSQAFIICPFIEESESLQTVKAAKVEFEKLTKEIFPDLKLGILHGKLKSKEKESVLSDFRKGKYDILVATPVVEVGIDIPNATIILIEGAERFGLAQLHQLRGRVGRGEKQSYCLLFTDSETAQNSKRLKGMETLHSGSELSELDLKLRGHGNLFGTLQHGIPKLKAASFSDTELIQIAKKEADQIMPKISKFPDLEKMLDSISTGKVSPD
jgi:ATP-dependent DNA helicase RecG